MNFGIHDKNILPLCWKEKKIVRITCGMCVPRIKIFKYTLYSWWWFPQDKTPALEMFDGIMKSDKNRKKTKNKTEISIATVGVRCFILRLSSWRKYSARSFKQWFPKGCPWGSWIDVISAFFLKVEIPSIQPTLVEITNKKERIHKFRKLVW